MQEPVAVVGGDVVFCEGCVWYVEQMRGTVQVTGRVAGDDIPAPDRDRLLAAFRGWRAS